METSGIVNTKICDIGPGNDNLFLQGIIVRTQEAKIIRMKRGKFHSNSVFGIHLFLFHPTR